MSVASSRPRRLSRVASANDPECPFPIENLPYGVFSVGTGAPRVGVAIGDQILDLSVIEAAAALRPARERAVFDRPDINAFMALGPSAWRATRAAIANLLAVDIAMPIDLAALVSRALVPSSAARLCLPLVVAGYTDFYASREHATNVGSLFRDPQNALMPNWLHIPIGYNGRASTVVVSGTEVRRPLGQVKPPNAAAPLFGPSLRLDYELELGAIVGTPSRMGQPVTTAEAHAMIFGYVLLNDWSARDIQAWEYQPLGPFQSKAFATSISPWIVTADALEPFRVPTPERILPLLPYLTEHAPYNFDLHLEIELRPAGADRGTVVSRTNQRHLYYSAVQQLAHHTVSGCAMRTGDLLGSGTISGPTPDSLGSLLETTRNGSEPLSLPGAGQRGFLEDGDTVTLRGWCQGDGHRIGFGECVGTILPAPPQPDW
jgi:fumarylacetoacetase